MNKSRIQLASLAVLLTSVLSITASSHFKSFAEETSKPNIFAGDSALKDLVNYRQWTKVNEIPLPIPAPSFLNAAGGSFV